MPFRSMGKSGGTSADRESVERLAMADTSVQALLEGKEVKKVIVVPSRLVNIVVAG